MPCAAKAAVGNWPLKAGSPYSHTSWAHSMSPACYGNHRGSRFTAWRWRSRAGRSRVSPAVRLRTLSSGIWALKTAASVRALGAVNGELERVLADRLEIEPVKVEALRELEEVTELLRKSPWRSRHGAERCPRQWLWRSSACTPATCPSWTSWTPTTGAAGRPRQAARINDLESGLARVDERTRN